MAELENKSITLAGDALLDPAYAAHTLAIARALRIKVMVNKLDFLHLQAINGGARPDDGGVAGVDVDVAYQNETVAANDASLRPQLTLDAPFLSARGSLVFLYEMLDQGIVSLYEFRHQYGDGVAFLQTGNPDEADPVPRKDNPFYGPGSVVDDLLTYEGQQDDQSAYWERELGRIAVDRGSARSFLDTQIFTRVAGIGRCAKTKEPFVTKNPWTTAWLGKTGFGKVTGPPIEKRHRLMADTLRGGEGMRVGDVLDYVNSEITQAEIRLAVKRDEEFRARLAFEAKEDWLLCIFNLLVGFVPVVGQAVGVSSTLYQRRRSKKGGG